MARSHEELIRQVKLGVREWPAVTREAVIAAVEKYNHTYAPYTGLWLSMQQIDHMIDAVRREERYLLREEILKFYSTAPKAANPLLRRLGMEEV